MITVICMHLVLLSTVFIIEDVDVRRQHVARGRRNTKCKGPMCSTGRRSLGTFHMILCATYYTHGRIGQVAAEELDGCFSSIPCCASSRKICTFPPSHAWENSLPWYCPAFAPRKDRRVAILVVVVASLHPSVDPGKDNGGQVIKNGSDCC